jgi:hypothetical protein
MMQRLARHALKGEGKSHPGSCWLNETCSLPSVIVTGGKDAGKTSWAREMDLHRDDERLREKKGFSTRCGVHLRKPGLRGPAHQVQKQLT